MVTRHMKSENKILNQPYRQSVRYNFTNNKRKRHIITDTQGLLLGLKVHAANEHDSRSGLRVLERIRGRYERMEKIYADGG